jgi:hypothetical protein
MPPLVKCLRPVAPAAAMVDEFEWNTQNTNKTQLLASNYSTFWSLVVYGEFRDLKRTLFSLLMWQASFKCETPRLEPKSSWTFLAIKHCQGTKTIKLWSDHEARQKSWCICVSLVVKLLIDSWDELWWWLMSNAKLVLFPTALFWMPQWNRYKNWWKTVAMMGWMQFWHIISYWWSCDFPSIDTFSTIRTCRFNVF